MKQTKEKRTLKKKEIVEFTAVLLSAFNSLLRDYNKKIGYIDIEAQVGDWAIESSSPNTFIESILKITKIKPTHGEYEGIDILGEKRKWGNAGFYKLPERCAAYLDSVIKSTPNTKGCKKDEK